MAQLSNDKLMQIFGTEELVKAFQEMNNEVQTKILSSSFKKASAIIISQAQSNLKGYTHVSKSFTTTLKKEYKLLNVGASKRKGGNLAHIAEAGTKERSYKTKNGNIHKTGKITGQYFWKSALNTTESAVEESIYNDIKKSFDKLLQKNKQ